MKTAKVIISTLIIFVQIFSATSFAYAHTISEDALKQYTIDNVYPDENTGKETIDPANRRHEGRTYFSFPEWYIVYSAQEYAEFVRAGGHPSDFPYIDAIEQFWQSVDGVKKATAGKYDIDEETNTVIKTIGVSFVVEYGVIALYESTIGRITKLLNGSKKSPEDIFYDQVAYEYGQFLNQVPWYEFPYFEKVKVLWTDVFGWNSLWIRGIERRVALTTSYVFKGTYALVIKKLAQANFESAEITTEFVIKNITREEAENIAGLSVIEDFGDGTLKVSATRYRAFRNVVLALSDRRTAIESIEGNDSILLSVLTEKSSDCQTPYKPVFTMPILTQPTLERALIITKVSEISNIIDGLNHCDIKIEHFYDY